MLTIAINGFGRIGRQVLKAALNKKNIKVAAINDLTDNKTLAHLLKYDSAYGQYNKEVKYDEKNLIVAGRAIKVFAQKDPAQLPWGDLKVDVVLECTGRFTNKQSASAHLGAGAKKVILSAPGKGDDAIPVYVRAVNCGQVSKEKENIISNASCTTNCIAPPLAVLVEQFGIIKGMMTTIHGYTTDQNLQDGPHKDLRRARAAAVNMIPTTTGAAKAVGKVIPILSGVFDGLAVRVPVPTVSVSDILVVVKRAVSVEEINKALTAAAATSRFKGVMTVTGEPLVSADFVGNTYSSVIDLGLTNVVGGDLVKVVAWYDNEVGYAHRMVEMAELYAD